MLSTQKYDNVDIVFARICHYRSSVKLALLACVVLLVPVAEVSPPALPVFGGRGACDTVNMEVVYVTNSISLFDYARFL